MGIVTVRIWNVSWRAGRPRFNPGRALRRKGYKGEDLRHDGPRGPKTGAWFTLDEASAWAAAKQKTIAEKKAAKAAGVRLPAAPRAPLYSVRQLFDEWYDTPKFTGGLKKGKREEKGLAQTTIADYKQKADALCAFDPELAASAPASVSAIVAQGVYEDLWEEKGLSMARGVAAVASTCWSWAKKRGKGGVTLNPWKEVEKTMPEPRLEVWEDAELVCLVAACDMPDDQGICYPEVGDTIYLGVFTGQRQNDRLGLLAHGRDDAGRRLFKQSKTGAIVAVPETPQLRARLEANAERRKKLGVLDPHVVINERTRRPWTKWHYRHILAGRRAMAAATETGQRLIAEAVAAGRTPFNKKRDQDFRDTAVTWLARAGCTPYEIASITGHSFTSIHKILQHYLALHPDMADAAIGKLVKWMEQKGMAV